MTRLALAGVATLALTACVADTYLAGPWDAAAVACGNAILEAGEACDDGNTDAGDGCSPTCTLEVEDCGNGIDDDGNGLADCEDSDCAADPACQPVCGNGILEAGEECDEGNNTSCDGCSSTCMLEVEVEVECGNGSDDDCDGLVDCADEADCEGQPCGIGLTCRGGNCL